MAGHPGWVAVAAISLETYNSTQSQVIRGLAVGGAVFTVIPAPGHWLARAALSPVERLRRQAAAISVSAATRRSCRSPGPGTRSPPSPGP